MASEHPAEGVPERIVARYLKLRAMADAQGNANEKNVAKRNLAKLERQYPGLRELIAEQDASFKRSKKKEQTFRDYTSHPMPPKPKSEDSIVYKTWFRAVDWALDQLASADWTATKEGPMLTVQEALDEQADYDLGFADDEDGNEIVEINVAIPAALWDRISIEKGGGMRFVSWLNDMLAETIDGGEGGEGGE